MSYKLQKSYRLSGYDYSSPGFYFITICTKNREPFFGQIQNGIMCLNEIGAIAYNFWLEIHNHYPYAFPREQVVMPDHFHGILEVLDVPFRRNGEFTVPTGTLCPQKRSVSVVIRDYKSAVIRWCREHNNFDFQWQSRFHDRIIRDEDELQRKILYIESNPGNWEGK